MCLGNNKNGVRMLTVSEKNKHVFNQYKLQFTDPANAYTANTSTCISLLPKTTLKGRMMRCDPSTRCTHCIFSLILIHTY